MKRHTQPYNQYRRWRQQSGTTLASLAAEADLDKRTLLLWEAGQTRLLQNDIRKLFVALKGLTRRYASRNASRAHLERRKALLFSPRPLLTANFSNLGKVN